MTRAIATAAKAPMANEPNVMSSSRLRSVRVRRVIERSATPAPTDAAASTMTAIAAPTGSSRIASSHSLIGAPSHRCERPSASEGAARSGLRGRGTQSWLEPVADAAGRRDPPRFVGIGLQLLTQAADVDGHGGGVLVLGSGVPHLSEQLAAGEDLAG